MDAKIYISKSAQIVEISIIFCVYVFAIYSMHGQVSNIILTAISLFLIFIFYYFSDAVHALKYANLPVLYFLSDGVWIRKIVSTDKTFLKYIDIKEVTEYHTRSGSGILIKTENGKIAIKSGLDVKNKKLHEFLLSKISQR